jgi:hypothetical protein
MGHKPVQKFCYNAKNRARSRWKRLETREGLFTKNQREQIHFEWRSFRYAYIRPVWENCRLFLDYACKIFFQSEKIFIFLSIKGIASSIPKNLPFNFPSPSIKPYFEDEGPDGFTISAYFIEPTAACTRIIPRQTSRSNASLNRLLIYSSRRQLELSVKEDDLDLNKWFKGQCFPTMGVHYWRNEANKNVVDTNFIGDPNADDFFPIFLLYNNKRLNGFGWAFNADLASQRYEHPTQSIYSLFFKQVPVFLNDPTKSGVISTLHVYLDSTPLLNFC